VKSRHAQEQRRVSTRPPPAVRLDIEDLQSQLEGLLDQVWRCEAVWRREDRIDQAIRYAG